MNYGNYDLNNATDLRKIIVSLTDGVWNSSDCASFDDNDIALIDKIRNFDNKAVLTRDYRDPITLDA